MSSYRFVFSSSLRIPPRAVSDPMPPLRILAGFAPRRKEICSAEVHQSTWQQRNRIPLRCSARQRDHGDTESKKQQHLHFAITRIRDLICLLLPPVLHPHLSLFPENFAPGVCSNIMILATFLCTQNSRSGGCAVPLRNIVSEIYTQALKERTTWPTVWYAQELVAYMLPSRIA